MEDLSQSVMTDDATGTNISSPLSTIFDDNSNTQDDKHHGHRSKNIGTPESNASIMDDSDVPPLKRKCNLLDIEPDHIENGVPVFKPSWEEFKDFYIFQKSINKYGMQSGIVKVIPPKEWLENEMPKVYSEEVISNVLFKSPITQEFTNHRNCFSINNIEKKKTFNLLQWKKLSYQQNYLLPPMKGEKDPACNKPTLNDLKKFSDVKGNTNVVSEDAYKDFDYNIDTSIYTKERCEYLENQYWKTISFSTPLYGADSLGSLFTDDQKIWNVAKLPNLLDWLPEKVPGVNDAYLYGGLWKASFSWHLEDQDLYSINYLHFGAPKQWYSISQRDNERFYKLMSEVFPEDYENCSEFLRHKTFLASPTFLKKHGINVNKITHFEKEFMITYPFGYHSGFNYGYNLAESVNFALDDWLDIGLASKRCMCIDDSVGINVLKLMRRLNGEESESETEFMSSVEEEEEGGGGEQKASDDKTNANTALSTNKPHGRSSKPKQQQCILCPHAFSKKYIGSFSYELLDVVDCEKFSRGVKYNKFWKCHRICAEMIAELSIEKEGSLVTSNDAVSEQLVTPADQNSTSHLSSEEQSAVLNLQYDKSVSSTHEVRAVEEKSNREVVIGYQQIPKARKNLKCAFCSHTEYTDLNFKGVCFQCAYGKCTRAFHATCSLNAGVLLTKDENDVTIGFCRYHRPSNFSDEYKSDYYKSLLTDEFVQFKISTEYYAGHIISNNFTEGSVTVLLYNINLSSTEVIEVPYYFLLIPTSNGCTISLKDLPINIDSLELEKRKEREEREALRLKMKEERLKIQAKRREERRLEKLKRQEMRKKISCQEPTRQQVVNEFELRYAVRGDVDHYRNSIVPMGKIYDNTNAVNYVEMIKPQFDDQSVIKNPNFEVWYYIPHASTDQVGRYKNDMSLTEPNDPGYFKFLQKQKLEKLRLMKREERLKRKLESSSSQIFEPNLKSFKSEPINFANQDMEFRRQMMMPFAQPMNEFSFNGGTPFHGFVNGYQPSLSVGNYIDPQNPNTLTSPPSTSSSTTATGPFQFIYGSSSPGSSQP